MNGTTEITDRRTLQVERAAGTVEWEVSEFDGGRAYMLVATTGGAQFHAHFTGEQWAAFVLLIDPVLPHPDLGEQS